MKSRYALVLAALLGLAAPIHAKETRVVETATSEIDVRVFEAAGDVLLLGFPCDEGKSLAEEKTAQSLSEDGIEVWMVDLLSAYMLPKLRSSLAQIETEAMTALIEEAGKTGKKVYLIASGPDTELVLRAASHWEASGKKPELAGAVLLFPRLFKNTPAPGEEPDYVDAVGKTRLPIILLEGERTPNRWGIEAMTQALEKSGSEVTAKVIPSVRGYFFKRQDANRSEAVVTSQLAGLIKVSLFYLRENHL